MALRNMSSHFADYKLSSKKSVICIIHLNLNNAQSTRVSNLNIDDTFYTDHLHKFSSNFIFTST